jgi:hypothetical protein
MASTGATRQFPTPKDTRMTMTPLPHCSFTIFIVKTNKNQVFTGQSHFPLENTNLFLLNAPMPSAGATSHFPTPKDARMTMTPLPHCSFTIFIVKTNKNITEFAEQEMIILILRCSDIIFKKQQYQKIRVVEGSALNFFLWP